MRLDLLISRLANDEQLRALMEETSNLPEQEVIDSIVKEFHQVVERYRSLSIFAAEAKRTLHAHTTTLDEASEPIRECEAEEPSVKSAFQLKPIAITLPSVEVKLAEWKDEDRKQTEAKKHSLRRELEKIDQLIHLEIEQDWDNRAAEIRERILRLKNSQQFLRDCLDEIKESEKQEKDAVVEEAHQSEEERPSELEPVEVEIEDDDILYLHAAGGRSHQPSLNDVKGIDGKHHLYRVEQEGIQFLFSKMNQDYLTVTKSNVLLLGKKESLEFRRVHEEISNELNKRESGVVPFAFGTVVRGKEEFAKRCHTIAREFRMSIESEKRAMVWSVKVFAIDKLIAELVKKTMREQKFVERSRYPQARTKRVDIKLLERMLQKEKDIAETMHKEFASHSSRATVHSMIGFGSGSSDDWKLILHSTYEFGEEEEKARFFATVCWLQETYRSMGVMLEVSGEAERISFANSTAT